MDDYTLNNKAEERKTVQPQDAEAVKRARRARFRKFVVLGLIFALASWALLAVCAWGSVTFAVIGLVLSAVGCKVPRGTLRNWSITGVIASTVLLVVFSAFWIVLNIL